MQTIPAALRRAAANWPEREALIDSRSRLTYAEYLRRVEEHARAVIASGVEPGDRVAIWSPNSTEFAIAAFATYFAGAAVVPINSRYRAAETEDILRRSGARGLFFVSGFLGRDYADELAPLDVLDDLAFAVDLTGGGSAAGSPLGDFLRLAELAPPSTLHNRESGITAQTISDIVFTSGTTGRPKGAMLMHGPSVRAYTEYGRAMALTEHDNLLGVPPFFHTFGLKGILLTAVLYGAGVVPVAVFDVHEIARIIESEGITALQGSPTVCMDLINTPDIDHSRLTTLRVAAVGASGLGAAGFERIRDELGIRQFANGYALTESHAIAARVYHDDDFETASTTSGRAVPGVELRIVDDEGRTLPAGEPGEILVRGYLVMKGYFDDDDATREAIDADGWLHTGDVGFLDDQERLHVSDRKKDMFVVGGFNAYPAEIEALLLRNPAIAEAAVIGVPDDRMGEVAKAYVVLRPGQVKTSRQLVDFAKATMANFKVPRELVIVDALPRNASGKVTKFVLAQQNADSQREA